MSKTPGTPPPGPRPTLFAHALRLHRTHPHRPLPRDGDPCPDDAAHRCRSGPRPPRDRRQAGRDAALILDAHFAGPRPRPGALADAFHHVHIPVQPDASIAAAAARAPGGQARRTGRWLVRHGTDRCAVTVGLALVAAAGTRDDIPLIQTIGLLSNRFGPLAAHALERLPGGAEALLWLADRVAGWGRVYVVEALCRLDDPAVRPWLLRRACDGDHLNEYFAGKAAEAARLHDALEELGDDEELADHTGLVLRVMGGCDGMGATLAHYPHAAAALDAYVRAARSLGPTVRRFSTTAALAQDLAVRPAEAVGCRPEQRDALREAYVSLLDREEWVRLARDALAAGDARMVWLADHRAPELRLRAFPGPPGAEPAGRRGGGETSL
ncbi:hypothetical protein AB0H29_13940 [Streptomyces thermolilacinus]